MSLDASSVKERGQVSCGEGEGRGEAGSVEMVATAR